VKKKILAFFMEYKVPLSAVNSESFARMYQELSIGHSKRLVSDMDDSNTEVKVSQPTKQRAYYNKKDIDAINKALRDEGIVL
jgi:hypothetical protein